MGWLARLKERLCSYGKRPQGHVGIYLWERECWAAEIMQIEDSYKILWQEYFVQGTEEELEAFKDRIWLVINGYSTGYERRFYLVLDGERAFYYDKSFPALSTKELNSSIKWEMSGRVPWEEDYLLSWYPREDGYIRIGAIRKKYFYALCDEWRNYWEVEGGIIADIDNNNEEGESKVIYAIRASLLKKVMIFSAYPDFMAKKNWRKIAISIWVAIFIIGIGLFVGYLAKVGSLQEEIKDYQGREALFSEVKEYKIKGEQLHQEIERKYAMLKELQSQGVGGYGLLMNLGHICKQGIWLEGLSADRSRGIILQGKAVDYHTLTELMHILERDKAFFQKGVILVSADTEKNGRVSFQLAGKL